MENYPYIDSTIGIITYRGGWGILNQPWHFEAVGTFAHPPLNIDDHLKLSIFHVFCSTKYLFLQEVFLFVVLYCTVRNTTILSQEFLLYNVNSGKGTNAKSVNIVNQCFILQSELGYPVSLRYVIRWRKKYIVCY